MMKNILPLIALIVFTAFTTVAQSESEEVMSQEGPVLTFEQTTIDYGTIEQNTDGHREFVFTNTGTEPVIINKCQGTCGCTVPKCQKEPVLPGEKGTIKVKYATNRLGKFSKGVKIYSNATEPGKPIMVHIKGNVLTPEQYKTYLNQKEDQEDGK